jgi:regulator of sigma E protease
MDPITLVAFIFILGALIFIHESGHYFVAKALGIKVEVFSLGFGPKLLRFQKGGTEYCISLLPVGGYVKMLGENPDESLRGSREEFQSRSKFERFLVLVMGASLNIVLAVVLTAGIYMHGVPEPLYLTNPPVVGGLDPNAAAAAAGLQVKDEIVAIDGQKTPTWRELQLAVALNPHKTLDFAIRRDGETIHIPITVRATEREQIGIIGIGPYNQMVVSAVEAGGAAEKAGIRPGDILAEVDGEPLFGAAGYDIFVSKVSASIGTPVPFVIEREGTRVPLDVIPQEKVEGGQTRGYVGVSLTQPMGTRQYGPLEAVVEGVRHNWQQASVLFLTLKKLVTGQLSPRTLSGPIDIYRLTGESLRGGFIYYISFMALVSLQLGIINLLPIPILDGGHIFILMVEGLIRRDLSMKIKERVMQFGFILLLLIMGSVLYMDVYKNFFLTNP